MLGRMEPDVRWRQRLNSFGLCLKQLDVLQARAIARPLDDIETQAMIKSFELCYELAWNLLKDWFEYQGQTGISGSRDAIRLAWRMGLLDNGEAWMQMIANRNRTAHTYNPQVAREVVDLITGSFHGLLGQLKSTMEQRAAGEP